MTRFRLRRLQDPVIIFPQVLDNKNMNGGRERLLFCEVLLLISPFVLWATLSAAARREKSIPRFILPLLRALRWFGWISGAVILIVGGLDFYGFHGWPYGIALVTFSIGLSFPESWVKQRLDHQV